MNYDNTSRYILGILSFHQIHFNLPALIFLPMTILSHRCPVCLPTGTVEMVDREQDQGDIHLLAGGDASEWNYTRYCLIVIRLIVNINLYINLRRSRDVFVRSFVCSFVTLASFSSLSPAFTLTVDINALYNESVHGREEHATWINTIPLKIATLLTLQTLKWARYFRDRCAHCIRDESPLFGSLASRTLRAWPLPWPLLYGTSVQAPIQLSNSLLLTSFITV